MANKHQKIAQLIEIINNAAIWQEKMRKKFDDDNIIYAYYDRNKAIRTFINTIDGVATGTCVQESLVRFLKMERADTHTHPQLFRGYYVGGSGVGIIFHQFITYCLKTKTGKWCVYYESYSNGQHKVVPVNLMLDDYISLEVCIAVNGISNGRSKNNKGIFRPMELKDLKKFANDVYNLGVFKAIAKQKRMRI